MAYIEIKVSLTDEQLKEIEEKAKVAVTEAMMSGALDQMIKDTIKKQVSGIVNEEIQTKGYRKHIVDKTTEFLFNKEIIDNKEGN